MTPKYLTKVILLLLLSLHLGSCKSFLDIKPYGKTIPKSVEEFSALLQNHLNKIDTGDDRILLGNYSQLTMLDAECGDDFEVSLTGSRGQSLKTYVGDVIRDGAPNTLYREITEIIRDCNIVLGELKERDSEEARKIIGTAHAMRGIAYYQMLRFFCEAPRPAELQTQLGLPIVAHFNMEAKVPRSNMKASLDFIEKDLQASIDLGMSDKEFIFTTEVMTAFLARFYFWSKQWQKAYTTAQSVVQKHPLLERDTFKKMMNDSYKLTGNQLAKSYLAASGSSTTQINTVGEILKQRPVSKRFIDAFGDEKERDIRYELSVNKKREIAKPIFCGVRAAEMKLIEAEAAYHLGDEESALRAINELRAHRLSEYQPLQITQLPTPNGSEIIKEDAMGKPLTPLISLILTERRKELFFEGDRFFEQKRNGSPQYWTAWNGRKYVTLKYMYTFPIPYRELAIYGEGFVQNPGYEEIISE